MLLILVRIKTLFSSSPSNSNEYFVLTLCTSRLILFPSASSIVIGAVFRLFCKILQPLDISGLKYSYNLPSFIWAYPRKETDSLALFSSELSIEKPKASSSFIIEIAEIKPFSLDSSKKFKIFNNLVSLVNPKSSICFSKFPNFSAKNSFESTCPLAKSSIDCPFTIYTYELNLNSSSLAIKSITPYKSLFANSSPIKIYFT